MFCPRPCINRTDSAHLYSLSDSKLILNDESVKNFWQVVSMDSFEFGYERSYNAVMPLRPSYDCTCEIETSNLTPDLQHDLRHCGISRDGFVSQEDLELALSCLVNERKGRLAVKALDGHMKANLESLDLDDNGYIDFKQIEEAMDMYLRKLQLSRYKTIFWAIFAISCVIFLGATFGLVYLVVDLRKDMSSINGQLVSRATGQPLQTASADFVIQNGIMTQRSTAKHNRRGTASESSDLKLLPFSAPVAAISSAMSQEQLSTLTSLHISPQPNGGAISLTIEGFSVVPTSGLPGGKFVVFQTAAGQLILNGTALSPAPEHFSATDLFALAFPTADAGNALLVCDRKIHV